MGFFGWFSLLAAAAFFSLFSGRTLFLAAKGIPAFTLGKGKRGVRVFIELGGGALFWLILAFSISQAFHPAFLPGVLDRPLFASVPAQVAGTVLAAAGLALFAAALASFGESWRIGIDKENPGSLVTGGVFGLTRNPVFLSMDLFFLGMSLIHPTWPIMTLTAVFVIGVHFHILEEERFLATHYGKAYREYSRRVSRYMPTGFSGTAAEIKTRIHVPGLRGMKVTDFLLNPTDERYRQWWPGMHLEFHILKPSPDHVGDVVWMDELVGKRRLRMKGIVEEAIPGRRIVWRMKKLLRLPVLLALDLEDDAHGVKLTHALSAGSWGIGRVLNPFIRAFFSKNFAKAMDEHAKIEFHKLKHL